MKVGQRVWVKNQWATDWEKYLASVPEEEWNVPAQYRAATIASAGIGSSCNVNGVKSAIAIGELNPGSAPTSTPIRTPSEIRMIFSSLSKSEKPAIIASIRLEPF